MKVRILKHAKPKFLLGVLEGGSLERRVLRLMEARLPWTRRRRVASAIVCAAVMAAASIGAGVLGVRSSLAQSGDTAIARGKTFEVVTIKPNKSGLQEDRISTANRNGYRARNEPLADVILQAYLGVPIASIDRVKGAPSWVMTESYDIEARADESTIAAMAGLKQAKMIAVEAPLLRAMLEERCKLVLHSVPTEVDGYALVVGKRGIKMKEARPDEPLSAHALPFEGGWSFVLDHPGPDGRQTRTYLQITMGQLTAFLSQAIPVIDRTGLTAKYDFDLPRFDPTEAAGSAPRTPVDVLQSFDWASIGLELKRIKVPSTNLVVDHIERPTEN